MFTLQDAVNALQQHGCQPKKSSNGYQAKCPCHDDKTASLSVKQGDKVPVVVHCFASCDPKDILNKLGLVPDKTAAPSKSKIVAEYDYRDAQGNLIYQAVRYDPKKFKQRHPDPNGKDGWIWNMKLPEGTSYVLYRLPELLEAIAQKQTIFIVEGEKDVDRLRDLGLVATCNISGAGKWKQEYTQQLTGAGRVVLIPDNDEPGRDHVQKIVQQLQGKVADLRYLELPDLPEKGDVSDWFNQGGKLAAFLALAEQAGPPPLETKATVEADAYDPTAIPPNRHAVLEIRAGQLPELADQAEQVLVKHDDNLYQRSGYLARVISTKAETVHGIRRPAGSVCLIPVDVDFLLDRLNRKIAWQKWSVRLEKLVTCNAPRPVASTLMARSGQWGFKSLVGIVTAPTLRPDGTLLDRPGYDAPTGLLFVASEPFPDIPKQPTRSQARAALDYLVTDLLGSFTFAKKHDRSAALSAISTALVRPSLRTAPIHGATAPTRGSGKTLLTDVVAMIATGRPANVTSFTPDPDEQRKRILTILMSGYQVVNLDNLEVPLEGEALCTALTSETFSDRILGTQRQATAPTCVTWMATGNNLIARGDMNRRVIYCALDPKCERPEERHFEKDLYQWVPDNRPALVAAVLTFLRAYVVAGRPSQKLTPFGGFDDWNNLIRCALVWLGEDDPLLNRSREQDDPISTRLRLLILAWFHTFKSAPATTTELVLKANDTALDDERKEIHRNPELYAVASEHFSNRRNEISAQFIGEFIRKNRLRIEAGARFEEGGDYGTRKLWKLTITNKTTFDDELRKFLNRDEKGAQGAQGAKEESTDDQDSLHPLHPLHPFPASTVNFAENKEVFQ